MKHFFKNILPSTGAAVLAVAVATNVCGAAQTNESAAKPAARAEPLFPDEVVARGKGFELSRSQLDDEIIRFKGDLARLGRTVRPDQAGLVDRQVLEGMIQMRLLLAQATYAEKIKARETAEKRLFTEKTNAISEESFSRQLKAAGLTPELYQARLTESATAEAVLLRELNISVSDEAVKKFYDDNPARFEQPEMARLAHILFLTRDAAGVELTDEQKQGKLKKAEAALKRLKDGEDFAKVAKEYSEDDRTKDRGGELQPLPRGTMKPELPEFEDAAFSTATNQVSNIVTTRVGYHIIKVLEKIPAKKIEFEKVADTIRQALKAQEIQKRSPAYLEKLRQAASVDILDEKLKAVILPTPDKKDAAK